MLPTALLTSLDASFATIVHLLMLVIEAAGIAAIVIGATVAGVRLAQRVWRDRHDRRDQREAHERFRSDLGHAILLGLELLVAADIIGTVAVEPTLDRVAVLGGIVLIRTFLSWSLEVEINGHWPWQAAALQRDRRGRTEGLDEERGAEQ